MDARLILMTAIFVASVVVYLLSRWHIGIFLKRLEAEAQERDREC